MITPRRLQEFYIQGKNITKLMKEDGEMQNNTEDIIEIAYDLQTGSYIESLKDEKLLSFKNDYASELSRIILDLCEPSSIMEAGIGEATTLCPALRNMKRDISSYGFDLSWSRIAYARQWLKNDDIDNNTTLCTGSLLSIPFADNSIDIVYTSHSIEPNGGNEEKILRELFRVTRKFLVLLEPSYEFANNEGKTRMNYHGYCRNLKGIAESLGYNVLHHALFPYSVNPLNPTAITIIEKDHQGPIPSHTLACPKFKTPLELIGNMLFSSEALVVYPIVGGIPCLRPHNAIVASKYKEILKIK